MVVHLLEAFTVNGLYSWENWVPLACTTLYGQGENLDVSVWPGSKRNIEDITCFIAKESRSFVVAASGLMRKQDMGMHSSLRKNNCQCTYHGNGGSCIAAPDGSWVLEPVVNKEALIPATINLTFVLQKRQNFHPSGLYSRPDVFS